MYYKHNIPVLYPSSAMLTLGKLSSRVYQYLFVVVNKPNTVSLKQEEEKRRRKLKRDQRKLAVKEKSHVQTVAGMAKFAARQIAILSGHSQRTVSDGQPSNSRSVEKKRRAEKRKADQKENQKGE